ncbi:MAG TPA: hypothetical protein VF605_16490 [Allosphingosinicella sp.]
MQKMQLLCQPAQLRMVVPAATCVAGTERFPHQEEVEMRIVETGMAGVIALASQFLIIAAVLL